MVQDTKEYPDKRDLLEEKDAFLDKYKLDEKEIEEYNKISKLLEFDIASLALILLISVFAVVALGESANMFGIEDFLIYVIFFSLVIIWGIIFISLSRRMGNLGISETDIVYHHLAAAINKHESEPLVTLEHLKKVNEALEDEIHICHPKRESEISAYIKAMKGLNTEEEKKEKVTETFEDFIEAIVLEIIKVERTPMTERVDIFEEVDDKNEDDNETHITWFTVISKSVQDLLEYKHVKLAIPFLIFASALIAAIVISLEVAAVILGGLTLIQTITNVMESENE